MDGLQTRREFIRSIARKSMYTVPLVVSFSKDPLSGGGHPSNRDYSHDDRHFRSHRKRWRRNGDSH